MGNLEQVNEKVSMTLDKLQGIRGNLVWTDETWETWDFLKLCKASRLWTRPNSVDSQQTEKAPELACHREWPNKLYDTRYQEPKPQGFVYCDATSHKSGGCPKITTTNERKHILAKQRLCFNCIGTGH